MLLKDPTLPLNLECTASETGEAKSRKIKSTLGETTSSLLVCSKWASQCKEIELQLSYLESQIQINPNRAALTKMQ